MDLISSSALEEICSSGPTGITILNLWPKLVPSLNASCLDLCSGVKQAVWSNLLSVQGLLFRLNDDNVSSLVQLVEAAEEMNVNIVAEDHLRDCFVGLYDLKAREGYTSLSSTQRRALERLAIARSNGITQSELAKEFGMAGNEIFYVLRSLECQGLIVRQSTVVWRKGGTSNDDNSAAVNTNMLYLYRYAKHLGSHQRLEITKEDESFAPSGDIEGESFKEDVLVKDFLPALKSICDKLEEASRKVLVVRDIKQDLGYQHKSGHRAWRNIFQKLKDANVVEELKAKVNNKVVPCLRLLKSFDDKTVGHGNDDEDSSIRGLITDQVVELPIEHQIYDMIDAEGSKGLTVMEACRRLGISNKKYYNRLISMFSRFGMHLKIESHKKGTVYRVWTPGNFNPDQSNVVGLTSTSKGSDVVSIDEKMDKNEIEQESSSHTFQVGECADMALDVVPLSTSRKPQLYPRYPCRTITDIGAQREQRILEKLKEEKFIIRAELQKWLENFEDRSTKMDCKTLIRILNRLQQQGQCKCISVSVPVVTNFSRSRSKEVILHPSVQNLPPQLLTQIHDKLRSVEMQSRCHGISRLKDDLSAPVLNFSEKNHNNNNKSVALDGQVFKSEAMRTNGFVLAKMIRAKLLHKFLWNHLRSSSPQWDDDNAISSGEHGYDLNNPHSICKKFSLDNAIKAIPLELFLQVVGSTEMFDDLLEKCKSGKRLCDLPVMEYKSLMDTLATARLSWIIDILRRLKLIRMVSDGDSEVEGKVLHTTFKHAMELKPYIEEPRTIFSPSSDYTSLDLRPQIRHDFILLKKDAVDDYWKTLEYCYSAADHTAALHAFPGSAVHEVNLFRSWASVRVMTAEQRAELLKRVVNEDPKKNLSMKDCDKIARDLHLTLQQVLRVYYDKRQERLKRFQRALDADMSRTPKRRRGLSSSCKRKRSSPKSIDKQQETYMEYGNSENVVEKGGPTDDEEECCSSSKQRMKPMPPQQNKFSWSENSDRQLVMQYARHRARLGANYHRTDWSSVPNLPGPPTPCKRRIATLKRNISFRKSVMKLCNLLGERYSNYLEKIQDSNNQEQWDNFDDKNIQMALDDALLYKRVDKLQSSKKDGFFTEDLSYMNPDTEKQDCYESELVSSTDHLREQNEKHVERQPKEYGLRSSFSHHLPRKLIKHLSEAPSVSKRTYTSLAVSNAVELWKLVFLNTSTAMEVPTILAETLRRYSDEDLFAAFSYLKELNFMTGGSVGNSLALSKSFWMNINSSPFPPNTGERAAKFSSWVHENKNRMQDGVNLIDDLQCGDIMFLCSLVSSGELSISPCLPNEGVGDVNDSKTLKRKADNTESSSYINDDYESKKVKSSFFLEGSEMISRREKGFPGLTVLLSHGSSVATGSNVVDLLQSEAFYNKAKLIDENINSLKSISLGPVSEDSDESLWEAMKNYADHSMMGNSDLEHSTTPISSAVFRTVCIAIQKAGDQGLSMDEVSKIINNHGGVLGEKIAQMTVDVLVTFGHALKVNAYNSVHVVNALFRSKYFITSVSTGSNQQLSNNLPAPLMSQKIDNASTIDRDTNTKWDGDSNVHRVTILNLTEVVSQSTNETNPNNEHKDKRIESFIPILPWINGDGTINKAVYKGLVRRILGVVMENPGILEDDIIQQIDALNPQNCRSLLELIVLDKHLIVRKMHQTISNGPPLILGNLFANNLNTTRSIYRKHFFANTWSAFLL